MQLVDLAEKLSHAAFITILVPVFGKDVPGKAYRELYKELIYKYLPQPNYKVEQNLIKDDCGHGHEAGYNKLTKNNSYLSFSDR